MTSCLRTFATLTNKPRSLTDVGHQVVLGSETGAEVDQVHQLHRARPNHHSGWSPLFSAGSGTVGGRTACSRMKHKIQQRKESEGIKGILWEICDHCSHLERKFGPVQCWIWDLSSQIGSHIGF